MQYNVITYKLNIIRFKWEQHISINYLNDLFLLKQLDQSIDGKTWKSKPLGRF